jgi:hypothetical protein
MGWLRSRHFYAAVFLSLAAALVVVGSRNEFGWWSLLVYWLSLDLAGVGLAYLVNWKTIFGKTAGGSLRIGPLVVMLPHLAITWSVWHLHHWMRAEPIWDPIAPGLFVGRRCRFDQLPPGTAKVLDFTAEFPGDRQTRRTLKWLSVPLLDGCAPGADDYQTAFAFLAEPGDSVLYMYCANGHGRSATFACALLIKLGLAPTPEAAVEMVTQRRHGASPNQEQVRSLQQALKAVRGGSHASQI